MTIWQWRANPGAKSNSFTGITRNQVLIVVCSLVIAGSIGGIITFITSDGPKEYKGEWQCLQCGLTFSRSELGPGPIACPKCSGEAVRLIREDCPKCGKQVIVARVQPTEQGRAMHEEIEAQRQAGTFRGIYSMAVGQLPYEAQYRIKLSDGQYGWTEQWHPWVSYELAGLPADAQITCEKCGTPLRVDLPQPSR